MFGSRRIKLNKDLSERVKKYADLAGYSSPEEFLEHVLEKEMAHFDPEGPDKEEIKKRMQGLGYTA